MNSRGVIKIARPGADALTVKGKDLALDSNLQLPKIYKSKRVTTATSISHGFDYPIQYLAMREITTSPKKFAYALPELTSYPIQPYPNISSDDTYLHLAPFPAFVGLPANIPADKAVWGLFLADPCVEVETQVPQTRKSGPVVKIGGKAMGDADYELSMSSHYDSLKVAKSGMLTLSVPSWNAPAATMGIDPISGFDVVIPSRNFVSTDTLHGLDYVPYYMPFLSNRIDVSEVYLFPDSIPSVINLDEIQTIFGPTYGWPRPSVGEYVYIWVSDSKICLEYERLNWDNYNTYSFPARTVNLGYTIFYNRVDEEFDLLTN